MKTVAGRVALLGILFAVALALSFLESLLPPLPLLPPGIKLGLSNIITMYCLFWLGPREGYLLTLLKAGFALLTRGAVAGLLSGCGGFFSVTVMLLLSLPKRHKMSVLLLSICGAVSHNLGQLGASCLMIGSSAALAYLPLLLLAGIGMGALTGLILRVVLPATKHILQNNI